MDKTDPRIERVARALCKADGKDPDQQVSTGKNASIKTPEGAISLGPEQQAAWKHFEPEARRFLAALEAAGSRS
jgi:hypothetical protein